MGHCKPYDYQIIEVMFKHETDKAVLVEHEGEEEWLPKSQLSEDFSAVVPGELLNLEVPTWLLKAKGWA